MSQAQYQSRPGSSVDQTLFGSRRNTPGSRARSRNGLSATVQADSVVIGWSELQKIKASARISRPGDKSSARTTQNRAQGRLSKAAARKEKMLKLENERKAQKPKLREGQKVEQQRNRSIYGNARKAMDEELDDVKHMNQMMLYAKCATIRDKQIAEKQRIRQQKEDDERRLDAMMELERLRIIKSEEDAAYKAKAERRAGASVIVDQIRERENRRIREQERREQEGRQILLGIKQQEERERLDKIEQAKKHKFLREEVMKANSAQAAAKQRKKQEALDEDLRIAEYLRQKELREQEEEEERDAIKKHKENEIARLRSLQEKAQDRRSEIDELRAKRYQEEKDRIWRNGQLATAQKKQQMIQDMREAREFQRNEKSRLMAEQALQERQEYYKNLEWQKTQNAMDAAAAKKNNAKQAEFRQDLLHQIDLHQQEQQRARVKFLKEGQGHSTVSLDEERYRLEQIKAAKIKELQDAGVPEKYLVELRKKKVLQTTIFK